MLFSKPYPADPAAARCQPTLFIAYDPKLLSPAKYARLVRALGDVVRDAGGIGLVRLASFSLTKGINHA